MEVFSLEEILTYYVIFSLIHIQNTGYVITCLRSDSTSKNEEQETKPPTPHSHSFIPHTPGPD
jgi:hypothetical protein